MGIEPTLLAWKAKVLPLNYTRKQLKLSTGTKKVGLLETSCFSPLRSQLRRCKSSFKTIYSNLILIFNIFVGSNLTYASIKKHQCQIPTINKHYTGGGGRIRTYEGVSRQIYSLFPLAAREPLHNLTKNISQLFYTATKKTLDSRLLYQ